MKLIYLILTLFYLVTINHANCANMNQAIMNQDIPQNINQDKLVPREILFGNPDRTFVRISPDGKYISYLAPHQGVMNIWLQDIALSKPAIALTEVAPRPISSYYWSYDNKHIIYSYDEGGNENYFLYKVDINTKQKTVIFEDNKVKAEIAKLSSKFPNKIVIALNKENPEIFDLYNLDIQSGALTKIFDNSKDRFVFFEVDDELQLKLAGKTNDEGDIVYYIIKDNNIWQEYFTVPYENSTNTHVITVVDKNYGYMLDSRKGDKGGLYKFNLQNLKQELIAQNDKADISSIFLSDDNILHAASYEFDKTKWIALSDDFKKFEQIIAQTNDFKNGAYSVISTDLADNIWLIALHQDNKPHSYYMYDKKSAKISFIFSSYSKLAEYEFSHQYPVEIKSRDGLSLMSYLTIPRSANVIGYKPKVPLPTILFVHGGPIARDSWGFISSTQWLADRGYAVLMVNYRGSTGFGSKFFDASSGQWAKKMHDDLIDARNWAVAEGIADPKRFAIMGGSYGGYATLLGLTITPDVFTCGIDIVGMSNLVTKLKSMPAYWRPFKKYLARRMGASDDTPEGIEYLKNISPLTYVDNIIKPLLIAHGANDPRVNQDESEQIVNAMRQKKIPVTYLLYPDEGHGFARPANKRSFNTVTEEFLHRYLGGKLEPRTEADFKDSTIIEKNY